MIHSLTVDAARNWDLPWADLVH